jgi:hypothetical protein
MKLNLNYQPNQRLADYYELGNY